MEYYRFNLLYWFSICYLEQHCSLRNWWGLRGRWKSGHQTWYWRFQPNSAPETIRPQSENILIAFPSQSPILQAIITPDFKPKSVSQRLSSGANHPENLILNYSHLWSLYISLVFRWRFSHFLERLYLLLQGHLLMNSIHNVIRLSGATSFWSTHRANDGNRQENPLEYYHNVCGDSDWLTEYGSWMCPEEESTFANTNEWSRDWLWFLTI